MRLIDRQILWHLIFWMLILIVGFVHGIILIALLNVLRTVFDGGIPGSVLLDAYLGVAPIAIYLTLPLVTVVSITMAYSRWWADNMTQALFGAGVSVWRVARPAIVFMLAMTALGLAIANFAAPAGAFRFENAQHSVRHGYAIRLLHADRFNQVTPEITLFFERWAGADIARNVLLVEEKAGGPGRMIKAAQVRFARQGRDLVAVFHNGEMHRFRGKTTPMESVRFKVMTVPLRSWGPPERISRPPFQLATSTLINLPPHFLDDAEMVSHARAELHKRFVIPLLATALGILALGAFQLLAANWQARISLTNCVLAGGVLLHTGLLIFVDAGLIFLPALVPATYTVCALAFLAGVLMLATAANPRLWHSVRGLARTRPRAQT